MNILHIWPQEPVRRDGSITVSAAIEVPGEDRKTLWYSVPESQQANLAANADPFVIGAIYLIMQSGHDVQVHGEVSPSLLRNLEEFQVAWAAMKPGLKRANITADRETEISAQREGRGALVAFSGGVDSCFSAFRHARGFGTRFPYRVEAGLMVHGFDVPLDEPDTFASAFERSKIMLSSLGLEAIPVVTNYRAMVSDWTHSYGAALASCLMLLSGKYSAGLIGQGLAYAHFHHLNEGSNPLTDPLLSSSIFKIVPDGGGYLRAEKIQAMRNWEEFLVNLRVCWEGAEKDRNCCRCEKCIRNILTFRALGLGLPLCFDRDVSIEQILGLRRLKEITMRTQYDNIVHLAHMTAPAPWVIALEKHMAASRRPRQGGGLKEMRLYRWSRRQAKEILIKLGLKNQS